MSSTRKAPPTRPMTTAAGDQPVTSRLLPSEPDSPNAAADVNAIGSPVRRSTVVWVAVVNVRSCREVARRRHHRRVMSKICLCW